MASLTGQTIASTYDALLKVTDNGPITSDLKLITDGLGNSSSLSLSSVSASITGTLSVSSTLSASNLSGTNTGDETQATIKSKLGAATTSVDGYLTSTNWNTFNGKENVLTFSAPLSRATNTISIPAATTSVNGYLTSTDWTTFNNKVATTRTISTTSPLSGGGDLSANRTLSISQATTSTDGYLSSTDWNTFNGKQSALTNPVTASGTRTAAYLPIFSSSDVITNSDISKVGSTYNFNNSSNVTISRELKAYDLSGGDYTLSVTSADVLINTQLRVSNYGSNTITLNGSGLSMGSLPISGATTLAIGGTLTGATDITGSGKLSIANIGASGTLNLGSTTTATKRLEITGDNNSGENNTLRFVDTDTTTASNQVIGKIEFFSNDATAPGGSVKAYISAQALDTSPDAYLDFATDTTTGTPTVRQRITNDGKVLIGSTTDNATTNLVQVNGGLDYNITIRTTSTNPLTLALTDKGKFIVLTAGSSVVIPAEASVNFPIGSQMWFVQQGVSSPTFSGDTGVTLNTRSASKQPLARYAEVKLTKTASDTWYLTGDLKA